MPVATVGLWDAIGPQYDLGTAVAEIVAYLKTEQLNILLIAAGGIFTGSDAASSSSENGASAIQVATRFTVANEWPARQGQAGVLQRHLKRDIVVNTISPTGYPMRMLRNSPAIGTGIRPNCEAYGYLLRWQRKLRYIDAYNRELALHPDEKNLSVKDKTCLCTHMRNTTSGLCGSSTYRLKDTTTRRLADGTHLTPSAEHIFKDYQFSVDNQILLFT